MLQILLETKKVLMLPFLLETKAASLAADSLTDEMWL